MIRRSILVLSLIGVVGAGAWAQSRNDPSSPTTAPTVISGGDVGVRLSGPADRGGAVRGTLVVKINGRWVDVVSQAMVMPAGK